jgi:Ser/Thr protein kinase RdoA (MazF antagonist)
MLLPDRSLFEHYPALFHGQATPQQAPAFSGAAVWRLETPAGPCCVRAWPVDMTRARLDSIHLLLERAAGLDFVPRLVRTQSGATFVQRQDRFWELTTWQRGCADFLAAPSPARMAAACRALAELHLTWAALAASPRLCPAVMRRLAGLQEWQHLLAQGWRPQWCDDDPVAPWAQRAWALVQQHQALVPQCLARWQRTVAVQPCLCDVWHAHVLFEHDTVTGLVDYGSVKLDHVAVDLARLLGSLARDDAALRRAGLEAYAALRPLAAWECVLIDDLDATGTVIAMMNWLRWLYHESRTYPDRGAVAERLAALSLRTKFCA